MVVVVVVIIEVIVINFTIINKTHLSIILCHVNTFLGGEMVSIFPRTRNDVILHQWKGCRDICWRKNILFKLLENNLIFTLCLNYMWSLFSVNLIQRCRNPSIIFATPVRLEFISGVQGWVWRRAWKCWDRHQGLRIFLDGLRNTRNLKSE
jgi:homospermidine synthase